MSPSKRERKLFRELRAAERLKAEARRRRNRAILEATEAGMSRREIAALLGKSVGWVQLAVDEARAEREASRESTRDSR